MVKCPKCGFEQPEDRYCANCGVDMSIYVPPAIPLWKRLIKSPLFQLLFLLLLIGSVTNYVRQQQKLSERLEFLDTGTGQSGDRKRGPRGRRAGLKTRPSPQKTAPPPAVEKSAEANEESSRRTKFSNSQNLEDSSALDESSTTTDKVPENIIVEIFEVDMETLIKWVDSSQNNNLFYTSGDLGVGLISGELGPSKTTVKRWQKKVSQDNREIEFFEGTPETDTLPEMGFRIFLSVDFGENGQFVEIEILRSLPIVDGESIYSDRQVIKETFQIKEGETLFAIGLLPQSADAENKAIYPKAFSTLFKESYQNKEVDLSLKVQLK